MGDKKQNTTSKIRICDAVLTGLLRKDLRLVGYWLVANQSHQIEYHRQKIHSFKTRIGGDSALEELLQCVGALATTIDGVASDQHGSKPADKNYNVASDSLISSDWIAAFNGPPCTDIVVHPHPPIPTALPNQSALGLLQPPMDTVAQQLSDQLLTFEHSAGGPTDQLQFPSQQMITDHAQNTFEFLPDIYAEPSFDPNLLLQQKSVSSDNSFVTQSTCTEHATVHPSVVQVDRRIESLDLPNPAAEIESRILPKWTEASAFEAAASFLKKPLTKDHQDLLAYVLNMGIEMERKCLDVMDAVRTWNSWSEDNLHLVPIKTNNQPKAFTFRPPTQAHNFAGWKIHLEDRPRQRYTKRTVQKWMTYMSSTTMGVWHSGITAKNFREALENGGLFCTIGGTRQEDLSYNILGGRRNHVTKVEALNIKCGRFEKQYEFKRYDTDLILPEYIIKNPLPRVIVFESQELNLRAVMFIIRHPLEKGPTRRPAKRTKKFDTLLGGELQIDYIDTSLSSAGPDLSNSLVSSEILPPEDPPLPVTLFNPEEHAEIIEDVTIPRLKLEQVDEDDLYCVSHQIAGVDNEFDGSRRMNSPSQNVQPLDEQLSRANFSAESCAYTHANPSSQWELPDIKFDNTMQSKNDTTDLYGWGADTSSASPRGVTRPYENCWYGNTEELTDQGHSHNAFEDAIFAATATQQVKRCRTSQVQY